MGDITGILQTIFDFVGINLLGSTVLLGIFFLVILLILLMQMGASRFIVLAFMIPLLIVMASSGWITQSWLIGLGIIMMAILLYFVFSRMGIE